MFIGITLSTADPQNRVVNSIEGTLLASVVDQVVSILTDASLLRWTVLLVNPTWDTAHTKFRVVDSAGWTLLALVVYEVVGIFADTFSEGRTVNCIGFTALSANF